MIKKLNNSFVIYFLLVLVSIPVILPFFHKGYFPTHDGEWAIVRLTDMFRSLRDHQFPVRYSGYLNFGYGYPLFNFTYPAPYYIGTLFHFLKFGFVDTIKILFTLSVVLSALTMYCAASEIWKSKTAGIISVVFYVYYPYRIVDLYARGSIGESLSFIFFPLILLCVSKMLDGKNQNTFFIYGSISYALLIMMHNIMGILFTPVLFIFVASKMYFEKTKKYLAFIWFLVLSYGLSAFFWLPALLEKNTILLSKIPIADRSIYFVHLNQLLFPKWGYGLPDHPDGFSYQLGLGHAAILFLAIAVTIFLLVRKKSFHKHFSVQLSAVFIVTIVLALLLMFSFAAPIWQVTPLLKEINYPWTLLSPIGLLISLLAGFLWIQGRFVKYSIVGLCIINSIFVLPHARPSDYINKGDNYYLTNDATTTSSQELMPLWVKQKPVHRPDQKIQIVQGNGSIDAVVYNSHLVTFSVNLLSKSLVRINTIYYPGWKISVDGVNTQIEYDNTFGVMDIIIPAGKHVVRGDFTETPMRLASDLISVVSLLVILFLSFSQKSNGKTE